MKEIKKSVNCPPNYNLEQFTKTLPKSHPCPTPPRLICFGL